MEENYILHEKLLFGGLSLPTHIVSYWANADYFLNLDHDDGIVLKVKWDVNFIVHIRPLVFIDDEGHHCVRFKVGCQLDNVQQSEATARTILEAYSDRQNMSYEDNTTLYKNLQAKIVTDPETKKAIFEQADRGYKESSAWRCWMCLLINVDTFGEPYKPIQRGIQHIFTNLNSVMEIPKMVHPYIPESDDYPGIINFRFSFCVAHITERSLHETAMENVVKLILERPNLNLEIPRTLKSQLKSKYERCHIFAKGYAGKNKKFYKEIFASALKIF